MGAVPAHERSRLDCQANPQRHHQTCTSADYQRRGTLREFSDYQESSGEFVKKRHSWHNQLQ